MKIKRIVPGDAATGAKRKPAGVISFSGYHSQPTGNPVAVFEL